jgi:hypothetical protein
MANILPGEWGGFPVDDQIGIKTAERKRKFAEALRQQATTPQGQMVGGIFVPPSITQYLASGLKQYQAGQLEREGNKQEEEIYRNRGETIKQAAQRYAEALKPKTVQEGETTTKLPFEPTQMDRFGSPQVGQTQAVVTSPNMVTKQPTIDDMLLAQQQYAQDVNDPNALMNATNAQMNYKINQQTRQDEREFKAQEAQLVREERRQQLLLQLQDRQLSREQQADLRRELAQIAAANKQQAQPYFQAVPTAQGYARFNARTGQMEPIDMGQGAVLPAAQDPRLQGNIAGAKEQAKADVELGVDKAKAIKKSDQLLNAAKEAELLLDKDPTASGIGAARDAVAGYFGKSPESAQTAGQLETLAGWMVANVPRMEGPQSNFDVQNYQTMAGKVGDRTVPVAERKKALKTLIQLQEKYKHLNQGGATSGATGDFGMPPPGAVRIKK